MRKSRFAPLCSTVAALLGATLMACVINGAAPNFTAAEPTKKSTPAPKKPAAPAKKKTPAKKPAKAKTPTPKKSKAASPKAPSPAPTPAPQAGGDSGPAGELNALASFHGSSSKEPTFIKSDSLTLNSDKRVFTYSGSVEVKQGEMTLTCGEIVGRYNERNQIETIDARTDIVITQGEMRGTSQKAFFEAGPNTITLTENPAIEQNGSVLSADTIKIYLNENRSVAEGAVRVKLVEKSGAGQKLKLP